MKLPGFRRRPPITAPDGTYETWDAETKRVIVHAPFNTTLNEDHGTTDILTDILVATVASIQAGVVGESIPEGVAGAQVSLQVEPSHRSLGPLEQRTLEIFADQLGASIHLSAVEGANPPPPEVESDDETTDEVPTPKKAPERAAPAVFAWDAASQAMVTTIKLPRTTTDPATRTLVKEAMNSVFEAVASPSTQELIPVELGDAAPYRVTIDLAECAVGPKTEEFLSQVSASLESTRLELTVK